MMVGEPRRCRHRIVGWDLNPPEPFPGFGGTVGLGQDMAVLPSGEWLLVFHAGYWHLSMATPFDVPDEGLMHKWADNGFPLGIDAPQGGRILATRSRDQGSSWSRPVTVLNTAHDDSVQSLRILACGRLVLVVNSQAAWYGHATAPPVEKVRLDGRFGETNTRTGVIISDDLGNSWSQPHWFDSPSTHFFYQRGYGQVVELPDGLLLYPTYCSRGLDSSPAAAEHGTDDAAGAARTPELIGALHCSADQGASWQLRSTLTRSDGKDIDEPCIVRLTDGRLLLITRPDAAVFYSSDAGLSWAFSHCVQAFAPLKPSRLVCLEDGTVVIWMTSHGVLCCSWSSDNGRHWRTPDRTSAGASAGAGDGRVSEDDSLSQEPFKLDPDLYGYPGGVLLDDGSIYCVYYDALNKQQKTSVWGIRFKVDAANDTVTVLPPPAGSALDASVLDPSREHRHPSIVAATGGGAALELDSDAMQAAETRSTAKPARL